MNKQIIDNEVKGKSRMSPRSLKGAKRRSLSIAEVEKLAEKYKMNKGNADDFDENETIPIKKY